MFSNLNSDGKVTRYKKAIIDCSNDEIIVEQAHKNEVDINKIIKRHGIDLVTKTAMMNSSEFRFDDVTGNDFQEALFKIKKAQSTFELMPSELRKQFDNNPAKFLDFVQNPENSEKMIEMGLKNPPLPPEQPVEVVITNPEPTPEPAPDPITETPA